MSVRFIGAAYVWWRLSWPGPWCCYRPCQSCQCWCLDGGGAAPPPDPCPCLLATIRAVAPALLTCSSLTKYTWRGTAGSGHAYQSGSRHSLAGWAAAESSTCWVARYIVLEEQKMSSPSPDWSHPLSASVIRILPPSSEFPSSPSSCHRSNHPHSANPPGHSIHNWLNKY